MLHRSGRVGIFTAVLLAASWLLAPVVSAAPTADTVSAEVSVDVAQIGDTVTLTVTADAATDVYGFAITADFDPDVVSYVPGSALSGVAGYTESVTDDAGAPVTFVHVRLGSSPAVSGDLELLTADFEATGAGVTDLDVSVELVAPTEPGALVGETAVFTTSASVEVAADAVTPTDPTPTPTTPTEPTEPTPTVTPTDDPTDTPGGWLPGTGSDLGSWAVVAAILMVASGGAITWWRRRQQNTLG